MAAQDFPASNRTWQILHHARSNGYAVGAFNCYNTDAIMAVIRAATRARSPAIIQLFPWTLTFQGAPFVAYVAAAARAAPVPVALHLDHCVDDAAVRLALTLPFDSVMVDASGAGGALNAAYTAQVVARARERGVAVEAEVGRIDGGEDGLPVAEVEAVMTDPGEARGFVEETGVHFLAPAFGNVHGPYPEGGAERWWQLDRLAAIGESIGPGVSLVLHGTHTVSDELFRKAIRCGVAKINLNRSVRDPYTAFVAENAGKLELTALKEQAVEIYTKSIERMMDVLGSSGMA